MEASFARSILVDAPMAIVAIDATGAVRSSNATADRFFGGVLTLQPPIRISELVDGLVLSPTLSAEGLAAFSSRDPETGEGMTFRARTANGGLAFVDIQAAPFAFDGEDFVTLFITDVTARVTAAATAEDLQRQVSRNWRLSSLGEIASMLAHELNQPLSAVANFLDAARTLAERDAPDQARIVQFIEAAEQQARRAGDVICRLRALLSKDTGYHATEPVAGVVSEILPILTIGAREHDAEIQVDIPGDLVARCDRVQLQQLLLNLVRNALDAPPTGVQRRIRITGSAMDRGLRMTVEDNGPGLSPEMREGLFAPMASSKPGGMGLGLSICRTIVEAHGGQIELVPGSLGGAAFTFTLIGAESDV